MARIWLGISQFSSFVHLADDDVGAPSEGFLCGARLIASSVVPLNHASIAPDSGWEPGPSGVPARALVHREFGASARQLKDVLVEAVLVLVVSVSAEPEFHVSKVGSGQLHFDVDLLQ